MMLEIAAARKARLSSQFDTLDCIDLQHAAGLDEEVIKISLVNEPEEVVVVCIGSDSEEELGGVA
eukprot:11335045-Karenia_brevis.AAC.1